jgi:hypothetical protein
MRPKTLLVVVALAVALLISAPKTFAQNLLANGSFETGDYSGWDTGGNFEFTQVVTGPFYVYTGAQDGSFYSTAGPVGSLGTIGQSFNDTAGASYTFSFYMASVGDDPSHFTAFWNNTPVLDMSDPNNGGVWTLYSFNETGTGHDSITFAFQDDPAYIALDNVSVTPAGGSTPEPSSILLLGTGILGLGSVARRKLGR